jgi:hypothetical protein
LERVLAKLAPDVLTLQESWTDENGHTQAAELGDRLGLSHAVSDGESPCAVLSRWPITRREEHALNGGAMPGHSAVR